MRTIKLITLILTNLAPFSCVTEDVSSSLENQTPTSTATLQIPHLNAKVTLLHKNFRAYKNKVSQEERRENESSEILIAKILVDESDFVIEFYEITDRDRCKNIEKDYDIPGIVGYRNYNGFEFSIWDFSFKTGYMSQVYYGGNDEVCLHISASETAKDTLSLNLFEQANEIIATINTLQTN